MNFLALLFVLLPVPQPGLAQAPAQAQAQAKGTVRGHVYAMDTGAPLKRVQVTLRGTRRQDDTQSTITDNQGAFEFRNVEPGTYAVTGSKTGYISSSYGQGNQQRGGASISVRADQDVTGIDLRLVRGGVISGVVTDEDGEPMVNVNVQAFTRTYRRGQTTLNPSSGASTDDRGQYRLYNLPAGRYYIQAVPRGRFALPGQDAMVAYAPQFYPNATTLKDAQRVDLASGGEAARMDMVVRPVPTVSVSGRVIDGATGKPATDSFVSIMGTEMMRGASAGSQVRSDGSFRVNGVLPGKARIMVAGRSREASGGRPYMRSLEVGHANIADLQILITPGTTVRGRVVGDGGTPPVNLRVTLSPRGDSLAGQGPGGGAARVNPELSFEIRNVQPGEYDVTVGGPASAFYVREVKKGTVNVLEEGLAVAEGAPVTDVEIVLDFQPGVVAGKAADENGDPVSGATVVLLAADAKKRSQDRFFRTARVDADGNFKVTGVIPGDYLALLWLGSDPYQVQDPDLFGPLERHTTRVSVEKGATANQDLKIVSQIKAAATVVAQ